MIAPRTIALTCIALIAFAANSILCRLALGPELIDAATFTSVRAVSGALTLGVILLLRSGFTHAKAGGWKQAAMLFGYMIFFSFAYVSLSTGTGALILFGAVQLTMFIAGLRGGETFSALSWAGLLLAAAGLIYLVSPGVTAPDPLGAVFMAIAGISWGFFSLSGRGTSEPLAAMARNFLYTVPMALLVSLAFLGQASATWPGFALAIGSGAVASGCGYVIWFAALPGLTASRAATAQLAVPAIAAIGGIVLLSEPLTLRLVLASAATLGGVALVLAQKSPKASRA